MPSLNTGNAILSNAIAVDSSYNVGIGGAASGSFKLQVTGTSNLTGALSGTSATFSSSVTATGNAIGTFTAIGSAALGAGGNIRLNDTATTNSRDWAIGNAIGSGDYGDLVFINGTSQGATPSSTKMIIKSGGNVLVNANSSTYGAASGYNLGVKGTSGQAFISIARTGQNLDSQGIIFGLDTASAQLTMIDNLPLTFGTNNAERMRIYPEGQIGIKGAATTEAAYALFTNDANTGFFNIFAGGSGTATKGLKFKVTTGSSTLDAMTITSGGRVGIGTTSINNEMLTLRQTTGGASTLYLYTSGVTTGQSYGLTVEAGTNSSDRSFGVFNQGGTTEYFKVRGDGLMFSQPTYNQTSANVPNMYIGSGFEFGRGTASSMRYKENINDWEESGIDTILALKPKTFTYKEEYYKHPERVILGLIAEEVAEVSPYLADYENEDGSGQVENVRYSYIVVPLIKAIQEQQAQIENQQQTINSLINR
jgi:hypothetical protein